VIIGISSLTTIAGLTAATFNGTEFAPGFAFGAPLPNAVTTFASPNGAAPDLELTITAFSTLTGFSFSPGEAVVFGLNVAHGSLSDDGIGEDYIPGTGTLSTVTVQATVDLGDAPDPTYPTLLASTGAEHVLGTAVYLGACVDSELDGQPSVGADGDDTSLGISVFGTCAGNDDEDGVSFTSALYVAATAGVDVTANAACTLSAWIDFNGDGDWADAGEDLFPGGQALAGGVNSLSFAVPAGAVPGTTYARFR
ncbi:MAG: hypothetical protein GY867_05955, partial [bacterium]|nr:hypothetical protein [bacterium]